MRQCVREARDEPVWLKNLALPATAPLIAIAAFAIFALIPPEISAQTRSDQRAADSTLEEIVVTAEKRTEKLQDVPASISVISGSQLETSEANSLSAYASSLPGLNVNSGGTPGQTQITIRGISTGSTINGSLVGTYIDEAPIGSSSPFQFASSFALDLLPYDLDRLEVLRGPQGTLYGASTMGGLVKYVLREPDLNEYEGRAGADVQHITNSGDATWGLRGAVNIPVIDGTFGVRVSGFHQYTAGYIDNVGLGIKNENPITQNGGRATFLWVPTSDIKVKGAVMLQDIDANGNAAVTVDEATGQPVYGRYSRSTATPEYFQQHLQLYSLFAEWNVGFATLTSSSSFSKTKSLIEQDLTYGWQPYITMFSNGAVTNGLAPYLTNLQLSKFTQELRLTSPLDQRLQWMLGGFYTYENALNLQLGTAENASGTAIPGVSPLFYYNFPNAYRESAVFFDATYVISHAFDVTGGVRYSKNRQTWDEYESGAFVGPVPTITNAQSSQGIVTWMASPRFHLNPDTMLYARVATGYRPGGPNYVLTGVAPTVEADTLTNYETGVKSELFDRRLQIDASIFFIKWDKIQITEFTPDGFAYYANGGTATSQGLELTSAYRASNSLKISGTLGFTNAHLTEDVPGLSGRSGDRLPLSARWNYALAAEYDLPIAQQLAPKVGGSFRHQGTVYNNLQSSPLADPMASQNIANLYGSVTIRAVTARLFANNVFNNRSYSTVFNAYNTYNPLRPPLVPVQPLTVGLSFDARLR